MSHSNNFFSSSLLLLLTPFLILTTSIAASSNCTTTAGIGYSLLKVEVKPDSNPKDNSWQLLDVSTKEIVHEVRPGYYKIIYKIYNDSLCIPSEACYRFTFFDSWGDGMSSPGYYKVLYENEIIMQGGNYVRFTSESSDPFGNACSPTRSPIAPTAIPYTPPPSYTLPPSSQSNTTSNGTFSIYYFFPVLGFCILFLCRQLKRSVQDTNTNSNIGTPQDREEEHVPSNQQQQQQQQTSTYFHQEQEQNRRLKVLTSIIYKKVLSRNKDTTTNNQGDNSSSDEQIFLPHEKALSSRRLQSASTQNINSYYDEALERTAQDHQSAFILPIPYYPNEIEEDSLNNHDNNTNDTNILKSDIYLTSLRQSQKSFSNRSTLYSPKTCPICLEDYKVGDEIAWSNNHDCPHAFHLDCIIDWLMENDECPLCRKNYLDGENR